MILSRTVLPRTLLLLLICLIGLSVLFLINQFTQNRISHNDRAWFEAQLNSLTPTQIHDNNLLDDRVLMKAPKDLTPNNQLPVYRARLHGAPTGAVINSITPDGYNGPIELLVAVDYNGTILGIRVLSHHETPNMGDAFAKRGSTWLDNFTHHSLTNPDTRGWNVRKDGGDFDQFTSATITPRAIIHAVQRTLDYYQRSRELIFQTESSHQDE